jgi:Zn-dependent M28 family amino/carboxypeptidase
VRTAAVLVLAVLLAGCGSGGPGGPSSTSSSSGDGEPAAFDGDAALDFVKGFALGPDGAPRYRIPGTVGQQQGAAYLWQETAVAGWQRTWQNLTGEDYAKLDRSAVASYTSVGGSCTQADHDRVPTLPFHNLLAVRSSGANSPLLLIGAHWDSQMHSDYDPDPAKRDLPDPGANDGASGVGLLLQMMRELDASLPQLPFSVGVLFIDGEDGFFDCYPLVGSLAFAQDPPVDVGAFILLDMVGDPGAKYPRESYSHDSAPGLVDLVWRHGQALDGGVHFINRTVRIQDDHVAFAREGIPSIDVIDAGRVGTFPPQWDTTGDTVDKLDPAMLALVGDTLLASMADPEMATLLGGQ